MLPTPPSSGPVAPPYPRVLGLASGGPAEMQIAAMRVRRPWWLVVNAFAALAALAVLAPAKPLGLLLPWTILTAGIALLIAIATAPRGFGMRHRGVTVDLLGALALGGAWTFGLLAFDDAGADGVMLRTELVCLVAVAAAVAAPMPAAGLLFIAPVTLAVATSCLLRAGPLVAVEIVLLGGTAALSLLLNARTLHRRIAAEQALAEKEEVVRLALREFEEQSSDWLWQTDAARRLTNVSPRLAERFGLSVEAVEGRALVELIAGAGWEEARAAEPVRALADKLLRRESFRDLVVPVTIGEETRWWSLSATTRRDERGGVLGFWGVGTDVTEQHRSAEKMDRMARFDTLTGLANRAHIIEALGSALRQGHHVGRRSTLMLIDLDRFKQVNDTLGHPIGDKLLIAVAGRLRGLAARGEVCGRLGGDEFAVVVPAADDRDRVEQLAEQIVATLSAPYEIDGHRLHVGASVGSATAPRDGRIVETLLRNADLALYRAKDDGRGVHRRYEPQLHAAAEERRRIEVALHEAIERGELRLAYQPIVDTAMGGLTGFEALLRWTHPDLGVIAPDVFIPIAEEGRLIGRIGAWVMHTACRDAAAWPEGVRVSVNLAAAQLKDPQLPATVVAALSHSGLDPARLELEIAEKAFAAGGEVMNQAADRLLALGVRMSLCDYGAGRSMSFLRKGRFSTMKIDRDHVRGVGAGVAESVAIVRAIVALADSLGMATVAEGAETRSDVERMRNLGCDHIQGWTVGQPLDADAARAFADERAGVAAEEDRQVA